MILSTSLVLLLFDKIFPCFFIVLIVFIPLHEQGKFYERSGNGKVVEALSRWVFREEGVLRVVSIEHHLQGDSQPPVAYTIKEDVVSRDYFSLDFC